MEDEAHGHGTQVPDILTALSVPVPGRPNFVQNSRVPGPGRSILLRRWSCAPLPESLFPSHPCSSRWLMTQFQAMKYKGMSVGEGVERTSGRTFAPLYKGQV